MLIHLDDPARLRDLTDYLRASGCLVAAVSLTAIEAAPPPRSLVAAEAERELDSYLLLWRAGSPGPAPIVSDPDDPVAAGQERFSLAQVF